MKIDRLLVEKENIAASRRDTAELPEPREGEVLARTLQFALTANNITYAAVGEQIGYWQFYPSGEQGWGIVPVWGHAEIVRSGAPELPEGTRFWGFLPMASHFLMTPVRASESRFVDGAPHRQKLPPVYNDYALARAEPPELAALADERSLMFPLFTTSWLIADYLADNALFGAEQLIIGSASSKTGLGTAWCASRLGARPAAITGLTSPGNRGFVRDLGFFDRSVAYDELASIDPAVPSVFVDMSGDSGVQHAVHAHFGDRLKASIVVGVTHWAAPRDPAPLAGPQPQMFFAPAQIEKRNAEWGAGEAMRQANASNIALARQLKDAIRIERHTGADAVKTQYDLMARGNVAPDKGLILAF